jgi:hypothetical protein
MPRKKAIPQQASTMTMEEAIKQKPGYTPLRLDWREQQSEKNLVTAALKELSSHNPGKCSVRHLKNKSVFFTVTGLHKPRPHPKLTHTQNDKILDRLYKDEYKRLFRFFRSLPAVPGVVAGKGAWQYEHCGVIRKAGVGKIRQKTRRGIWKFLRKGEVVEHVKDEVMSDVLDADPSDWVVKLLADDLTKIGGAARMKESAMLDQHDEEKEKWDGEEEDDDEPDEGSTWKFKIDKIDEKDEEEYLPT